MNTFETNRKLVLSQQTALRQALEEGLPHDQAIAMFLRQHAMLHSRGISHIGLWSMEDAILEGVSEEQMRATPAKEEHAIAWLVWHATRCEDITMNLLVAGESQVLHAGGWQARLEITPCDTGNVMDAAEMNAFNKAIDLSALRGYRAAVGRRTQQIAAQLTPEQLKKRVDPARLQRVWDEGALLPGAEDIGRYWGGRTFAGLLLMPASRHILVHWNEALEIKRRFKAF